MRRLLEANSTRDRLRSFWQRSLVGIAMLIRVLSRPAIDTPAGFKYSFSGGIIGKDSSNAAIQTTLGYWSGRHMNRSERRPC